MSQKNDAPDQPDSGRPDGPDSVEPRANRQHIITAKDAGWRSPGFFVAPATFVTIDPPEPKKRQPPS
jgi:hypothetical protein